MLGLVYLLAFLVYLAISIGVVVLVVRWAKIRNRKSWVWGSLAAFVMYNLVFWDWVPTVVAHRYYCSTQAGFWVYKMLDQWKAENPGVMETLVENNKSPEGVSPDWPLEHRPGMNIAHINQRFGMAYTNHLSSQEEKEMFLHVWRWKYELLDKKTGEILARQIDFSTGNGYIGGEPPLRFWLQNERCSGSREAFRKLSEFVKQFKGAQK